MRNIFISFRETERDLREGFEGMLQNPTSPLRAYPISSRVDVRNKGEDAVRNEIKTLLRKSEIVIFLIGNDSHNSKWIDYEASLALTWHYPYIVVRLPDTTGNYPTPLKKKNIVEVNYNALEIKKHLDSITK